MQITESTEKSSATKLWNVTIVMPNGEHEKREFRSETKPVLGDQLVLADGTIVMCADYCTNHTTRHGEDKTEKMGLEARALTHGAVDSVKCSCEGVAEPHRLGYGECDRQWAYQDIRPTGGGGFTVDGEPFSIGVLYERGWLYHEPCQRFSIPREKKRDS